MSVNLDDLKRMTTNVLGIIEKTDVLTAIDSEQNPEKNFPIEGHDDEYISVAFGPSSDHVSAHTMSPKISYYKIGVGIPLEVVINSYEGYSRIILKTALGILHGYIPFARDRYGNIGQDKKFPSTEIAEIRKELKKIIDSTST